MAEIDANVSHIKHIKLNTLKKDMFHLQNGFRLKAGFSKHSCMPLARLGPTNGRAWRFNGFNGKTSPSQQMNLNPKNCMKFLLRVKILFASNFLILPSLSPEFKDTPNARTPLVAPLGRPPKRPPYPPPSAQGISRMMRCRFSLVRYPVIPKNETLCKQNMAGRLVVDAKWCKHCGTSLVVSDYGLLYIEIMNEASSSWPYECWLIM